MVRVHVTLDRKCADRTFRQRRRSLACPSPFLRILGVCVSQCSVGEGFSQQSCSKVFIARIARCHQWILDGCIRYQLPDVFKRCCLVPWDVISLVEWAYGRYTLGKLSSRGRFFPGMHIMLMLYFCKRIIIPFNRLVHWL